MEFYYFIVGIALCGILVSIWNNRQENRRMQMNLVIKQEPVTYFLKH